MKMCACKCHFEAVWTPWVNLYKGREVLIEKIEEIVSLPVFATDCLSGRAMTLWQ